MTEFLQVKDTMSSLEIAELTGKNHSHVMRDIRNLLDQGVHESNFGLMFKITKLGNGAERKDPYYALTKKGCLILASGYDAKLREKIIDRWEELETEKRKPVCELSRKELALMVVQAEEEKERLLQENKDIRQQNQIAQGTIESQQEQIRVLAPKASYTDEVLQSTSTYTLTQIAHDLGMRSVHVLLRELCERRVLFRQSGQWQPTAKVSGRGYFETRTAKYVKSDNTVGTSLSTVVTERGRAYLHSMFNNSKN